MLLRLLTSAMRHERRRTLFVVVSIALATLAATALVHLALVAGELFPHLVTGYGANLHIAPTGDATTIPVTELDALDDIFWRNNVVGVAPLYELRVRLRSANASATAPIVGTWYERTNGSRTDGLVVTRPRLRLEAGRWPDRRRAPEAAVSEVVLGRRLAERLGVDIGDRVVAGLGDRRRPLRLVGIVGGGGTEEETAFSSLDVVQDLGGHPGTMTSAEVLAHTVPETEFGRRDPTTMTAAEYDEWYCTAFPSAIAHQIDTALPSGGAEVVRETAGATGATFTRLRPLVLALALIVLVGAAVGIATIAAARALARRRGCALLAALGATRGWIVRVFLAEATLLGAIGGLLGGSLGVVLGHLATPAVFGVAGTWKPVLVPYAAVVAATVSVIVAARPFLRVTAAPPAEVLGGTA